MKRINCPSCWHPISAGETMCSRCGHVFVDHKRLGMRPSASEVRAQREANRPGPGEVRKNMARRRVSKAVHELLVWMNQKAMYGGNVDPFGYDAPSARSAAMSGFIEGIRANHWSLTRSGEQALISGPTHGVVYASNSRRKSLDYGVVPEYEEFHRHVTTWKNEDGEGIRASERPVYTMELVGSDAECGREAAQDIPGVELGAGRRYAHKLGVEIEDVAALWAFINSLVHHADDADEEGDEKMADSYRDLASNVMYTLGYEWI